MARRLKDRSNPDRWLTTRNGIFYYKRRIPIALRDLDGRGESIKTSLGTDDLAEARQLRDVHEAADNELWAAMLAGGEVEQARGRYRAAVARAKALGFIYAPNAGVATLPLEAILQRIEPQPLTAPVPVVQAVVGTLDRPPTPISRAWKVFKEQIAPPLLRNKSEKQKKHYFDVKKTVVDHFIKVVGDLDVEKISREDARRYYDHWLERVAPREGKPTDKPGTANKRIGDLRLIYRDYFVHLGEMDRTNPFEKLGFKDKPPAEPPRLPFPHDWITDRLLAPGALAGLDEYARGIFLMVIAIGARPGEIANLAPARIVLDHEVPHIRIAPDDHDSEFGPREIKTHSSIRFIPLTGLALEVMRKFSTGFPEYRDNEVLLSNRVNKYLRKNKLLPTGKHTVYSGRHSFEDRMKNNHVDPELRKILMGHTTDRPEYGEGGSLALRLEEIKKVSLPFDPSIV